VKAVVHHAFGGPDVLRVAQVPVPVPEGDQILVRVHAAVVGVVDSLARRGSPWYARVSFGLRRPRYPVLGSDFAGRVEAVGPGVTGFAVGDDVFGTTAPRFGAPREYLCLSEHAAVAPLPAGLSYVDGAALADTTALVFLRDKARLRAGQRLLVNGASGAVGAAAVQLGVHLGAMVTGVCGPAAADLVRGLGARTVLDYTTTDVTRTGDTYDVFFDVIGRGSFRRARAVLGPSGTYLTTAPSPAVLARMAWTARSEGQKAVVAFTGLRSARDKRADLSAITGLVEAKALGAVVEAEYPLDRIADAHRRVDAGHKKGNVVVTM
jgi:NADPH:quinone reductase-like Zn-dependent oxidoreductase